MRTKMKVLAAIVCILSILSSGVGVFAIGYDVLSETNIIYQKEENDYYDEEFDEYWEAINYSTLISNFSNGFSVVYENCVEQTNGFVYFTTVDSSYVIDESGNIVDIGDYDIVGVGVGILSGRRTHFDDYSADGVDMYGGIAVCKNEKFGYVGLKDGVNIPCEHDSVILRYDENVFGVGPDYYLGHAQYFINANGEKLFSDIDLSPVEYGTGTFTPSIKYLGNNMFCHFYDIDLESHTSLIRYLDINGNEVDGYIPKVDESQIYYDFDSDALKNFYSYDYLELGDRSLEGNKGIFIDTDANGKFGLLDKNANVIVPYMYDDISGLQDGYCWAAKDGKWSLLKISTDDNDSDVDTDNDTDEDNNTDIDYTPEITKANIYDNAGIVTKLYDTYEVTLQEGNVIDIDMTGLREHKNGSNVSGYWTGFAVIAPENATQFKYVFDTEENVNWENALYADVEADVSGENDGAAFYTNAGATKPKTVVMLQWLDENGNALSDVTSMKMNLSAVSLYREPTSTGSTGGGSKALTVKFDTNGGTKINSVRVYKNKMIAEPTMPEKEGFTFDGWYMDNTFTLEYDFNQKVTKSFTLYAKWNEIEEKTEKEEDKEETNENSAEFTDIETDAWYYDVVKTAIEKGLMNGISDTEFAPMMNLTRGMFVTILYRAEGEPEVEYVPMSRIFSDINPDEYYADAVVWAVRNGIVNGMSETEFMPDENVTREQMATIIARFAQYKGLEVIEDEAVVYADNDNISNYAKEAVKITKMLGILEGNEDGSFAPKRNASRAEAATVFVRLLDIMQ